MARKLWIAAAAALPVLSGCVMASKLEQRTLAGHPDFADRAHLVRITYPYTSGNPYSGTRVFAYQDSVSGEHREFTISQLEATMVGEKGGLLIDDYARVYRHEVICHADERRLEIVGQVNYEDNEVVVPPNELAIYEEGRQIGRMVVGKRLKCCSLEVSLGDTSLQLYRDVWGLDPHLTVEQGGQLLCTVKFQAATSGRRIKTITGQEGVAHLLPGLPDEQRRQVLLSLILAHGVGAMACKSGW